MLRKINNYIKDVIWRIRYGENSWTLDIDKSFESFKLMKNNNVINEVRFDEVISAELKDISAITYDLQAVYVEINYSGVLEITEEVSNFKELVMVLKDKRLLK
ncbi:hypothetical protein [Kangiella taiwanensis]|uniref:Uncharacterized protein n=1 Tax=Kangiella taiwanensis TaxID=1079179 RepID=A0ABP8HTH0_9GAMM|nr:hypothetical protein [Kangiella taiwanensis]